MGLLLRNAFKGLRNKKVQMVVIILCIIISTCIYTTMNTAIDRLEERYYHYLESQNVEDFAFTPKFDYETDFTKEEIDYMLENELSDIPKEQKELVEVYKSLLEIDFEEMYKGIDSVFEMTGIKAAKENELGRKINYETDFTAEEIEGYLSKELLYMPEDVKGLIKGYIGILQMPEKEIIYETVDYILNNNGATYSKLDEKIQDSAEKYEFDYEKQEAKVLLQNKYLYKSLIYNKESNIDIPYIVEGRMPEEKGEITLLPAFAKENNLRVGDTYTISNTDYKVVGLVYSPEHIYPLISYNRPMFDKSTDVVIYMLEDDFKEFDGIKEVSYVAAFKDSSKKMDAETIIEFFEDEENIKISMATVFKLVRIYALESEIGNSRAFSEAMLYIFLGVSIFVILVITKKRIEDERLQIGVLKALGYSSLKISISYLIYPIIASVIGCLIGYVIGISLHGILTDLLLSFYNVPMIGYEITPHYLIQTLSLTGITLTVLTFIIALFMLRKKPLELLKEGSNLKVNFFSKIVAFITRKLPFKQKFKLSLASRSIGKLLMISLTAFCTGLLIVLVLIGTNLFNNMIDKTFKSIGYDNMVSYTIPLEGETSNIEDLTYRTLYDLKGVISDNKLYTPSEIIKENENKNNVIGSRIRNNSDKESEEEKKITVSFQGVDNKLNLYKVSDKSGNELISLLIQDTDIVINENVKNVLGVEIGDKLVFDIKDKEYEFTIVGINETFMDYSIYIDREYISNLIENNYVYNTKYTNDSKYEDISLLEDEEKDNIASVFAVKSLKENMEVQMEAMNYTIYVVIGFALILALIITLVISNIIVEENKRTISVMKVMGYKDREISSIVLNIYTPFIIIAYLLSIPAMINILKVVIKLITSDMDMTIPIEFTLNQGIIGLVGLLVVYYISIFISKITLNKIPLSVALKRE